MATFTTADAQLLVDALTEHGFRGTWSGPGYSAIRCACRQEFTTAGAFACHQADAVLAAFED